MSYSCRFVSCHTILYFYHSYRRLHLPYGPYYSFCRIHLITITVVRSVGSVEVIDQQSPNPSLDPPNHQPSYSFNCGIYRG